MSASAYSFNKTWEVKCPVKTKPPVIKLQPPKRQQEGVIKIKPVVRVPPQTSSPQIPGRTQRIPLDVPVIEPPQRTIKITLPQGGALKTPGPAFKFCISPKATTVQPAPPNGTFKIITPSPPQTAAQSNPKSFKFTLSPKIKPKIVSHQPATNTAVQTLEQNSTEQLNKDIRPTNLCIVTPELKVNNQTENLVLETQNHVIKEERDVSKNKKREHRHQKKESLTDNICDFLVEQEELRREIDQALKVNKSVNHILNHCTLKVEDINRKFLVLDYALKDINTMKWGSKANDETRYPGFDDGRKKFENFAKIHGILDVEIELLTPDKMPPVVALDNTSTTNNNNEDDTTFSYEKSERDRSGATAVTTDSGVLDRDRDIFSEKFGSTDTLEQVGISLSAPTTTETGGGTREVGVGEYSFIGSSDIGTLTADEIWEQFANNTSLGSHYLVDSGCGATSSSTSSSGKPSISPSMGEVEGQGEEESGSPGSLEGNSSPGSLPRFQEDEEADLGCTIPTRRGGDSRDQAPEPRVSPPREKRSLHLSTKPTMSGPPSDGCPSPVLPSPCYVPVIKITSEQPSIESAPDLIQEKHNNCSQETPSKQPGLHDGSRSETGSLDEVDKLLEELEITEADLMKNYNVPAIRIETGVEEGAMSLRQHKGTDVGEGTTTCSVVSADEAITTAPVLEDSDSEKRKSRKSRPFPRRAARGFFASLCACWHH